MTTQDAIDILTDIREADVALCVIQPHNATTFQPRIDALDLALSALHQQETQAPSVAQGRSSEPKTISGLPQFCIKCGQPIMGGYRYDPGVGPEHWSCQTQPAPLAPSERVAQAPVFLSVDGARWLVRQTCSHTMSRDFSLRLERLILAVSQAQDARIVWQPIETAPKDGPILAFELVDGATVYEDDEDF